MSPGPDSGTMPMPRKSALAPRRRGSGGGGGGGSSVRIEDDRLRRFDGGVDGRPERDHAPVREAGGAAPPPMRCYDPPPALRPAPSSGTELSAGEPQHRMLVRLCFRLGPLLLQRQGADFDPSCRYAVHWTCGKPEAGQGLTQPAQFAAGRLDCGPQGFQAFAAEGVPYPCERQQLRLALVAYPPLQQPRELTLLKLRLHNFPLRPRASQLVFRWGHPADQTRVSIDVKIQLKPPPSDCPEPRPLPAAMPSASEVHGWDSSELSGFRKGSEFARAAELEVRQSSDMAHLAKEERRLEEEFEDLRRRYRSDQQRLKEGDRRLDELRQEIARLRAQPCEGRGLAFSSDRDDLSTQVYLLSGVSDHYQPQGAVVRSRTAGGKPQRNQRGGEVGGCRERDADDVSLGPNQRSRSCGKDAAFCNCAFQ
eukprot:TRINITY_DN23684_c0_g1_i1.p1 TRINITY_DN23684_c0_g1~~TRINITY_DN23684_c0_g1_i1.p1  ORF type:complete len:423 (+),score=122.56 TRINITY_DN23684_c0_g1_i1:149-1417(+)